MKNLVIGLAISLAISLIVIILRCGTAPVEPVPDVFRTAEPVEPVPAAAEPVPVVSAAVDPAAELEIVKDIYRRICAIGLFHSLTMQSYIGTSYETIMQVRQDKGSNADKVDEMHKRHLRIYKFDLLTKDMKKISGLDPNITDLYLNLLEIKRLVDHPAVATGTIRDYAIKAQQLAEERQKLIDRLSLTTGISDKELLAYIGYMASTEKDPE